MNSDNGNPMAHYLLKQSVINYGSTVRNCAVCAARVSRSGLGASQDTLARGVPIVSAGRPCRMIVSPPCSNRRSEMHLHHFLNLAYTQARSRTIAQMLVHWLKLKASLKFQLCFNNGATTMHISLHAVRKEILKHLKDTAHM